MLPSEVFLVWAAGFFDGEGTVLVQVAKSKSCRRGVRTMLSAAASQTSLPCLNMLKERFGGCISVTNRNGERNPRHSVAYIWSVRNKDAMAFLHAIYPYTVVKKEQIAVALTYPLSEPPNPATGHYRNSISDELHNQRLAIGQKLRDIRAAMKTSFDSATEEETDA